jgi:thiol-disulfide isomerase/thioredoxin
MQKLTLMCVLAILCLLHNKAVCQNVEIVPFQIGERVPDLPLKNIINYKDTKATFSSFGKKLIIIDFWHTHCGTCIAMFPLEDSLQTQFKEQLQFLLVTAEAKEDVEDFLQKRNSLKQPNITIPIITNDIWLNKMFSHIYNPHYVFLAPNGEFLAQSSSLLITANIIEGIIKSIDKDIARSKAKNYPPELSDFLPLNYLQEAYLKYHTN